MFKCDFCKETCYTPKVLKVKGGCEYTHGFASLQLVNPRVRWLGEIEHRVLLHEETKCMSIGNLTVD